MDSRWPRYHKCSVNPAASSLFRAPHTQVMGILNVTPDSFSDGGRYLRAEAAIERGLEMLAQGAHILDIGGESTRPGSEPVSARDELARVVPVIEGLLAAGATMLSIDTMKPEVAEHCLSLGVRILNDVGGLRNPRMRAVAARHQASVVLMHMRGTPRTMQEHPVYTDVVGEIRNQLREWAGQAQAEGISDIAIDPGIGFGKTAEHNFEILRRLEEFLQLELPLLVGPSRKSFLAAIPGLESAENRIEGTIAACVISVGKGAAVLRVHDVAECARAIRVADHIRPSGETWHPTHTHPLEETSP